MKQVDFSLGYLVHILHGPIPETQMFFVTVGITAGTPVEETALEFVDRVRSEIETVHREAQVGDAILAGIAHVLNEITLMGRRLVEQRLLQNLLTSLVIAPG